LGEKEAFPLGNGRWGCMVFGGTGEERIQFNVDTLNVQPIFRPGGKGFEDNQAFGGTGSKRNIRWSRKRPALGRQPG